VQAALGAVRALLNNLGQYLSPHLGSILALLLDSRLLHSQNSACLLAADVRDRMCQAIPARLLLPALIQHLDTTSQVEQLQVPRLLLGRRPNTASGAGQGPGGSSSRSFGFIP
jgi:hypothetical protein